MGDYRCQNFNKTIMAYSNDVYLNAGESQDAKTEGIQGNITIQSSYVQTGTRGFDFNYTATGASYLPANVFFGTQILVVSGALGVDTPPTSEMGVFTDLDFGEGGGHKRYIRIGTDRKIKIYDKNGIQRGPSSTTLIPIMPPYPSNTLQEFHVVFDGLTLPTVFVKVYFGGTEELAFDTGLSPSNFFATGSNTQPNFGDGPASSLGAHMYADDLVARSSSLASDAPHLIAYPRLKGNGGMQTPPTSNGTYSAWTVYPAATNAWNDVDETGGNDGDTTNINALVGAGGTNIAHTFKSSAANPLPDPCTVAFVNIHITAKSGSVEKNAGAHFRVRLNGTDSDDATHIAMAASYTGYIWKNVPRPGGGSWAQADANSNTLEFGAITAALSALAANPYITLYPGPLWIYYTDTLASGTTPQAFRGKIYQVNQAVNRASTY